MVVTKKKTKPKKKYVRSAKSKKRKKQNSLAFLMLLVLLCALVFVVSLLFFSDDEIPVEEVANPREVFIQQIAPHAEYLHRTYGVLPSIILGQAALESDWGESQLGKKYHNLFGVKAYGEEAKVSLSTKEFVDGKWIEIKADFKVYPSWEASMNDHTLLFVNGVSWNPDIYKGVIEATNYKEAAVALQKSGYATDPDYASKIINVIEVYQLYHYDPQ